MTPSEVLLRKMP